MKCTDPNSGEGNCVAQPLASPHPDIFNLFSSRLDIDITVFYIFFLK